MNNGALVISLDFELLWGVFDKVNWKDKKLYFQNTRKVIPQMLQLFEKYEIQATWATVGMLFNEDWDEWNKNIPDILPEYENSKFSAYKYGKSIQSKETEALCFAPDLIKLIIGTPGQEIGTHTYSHFYCLEPGQDSSAFKEDLKKATQMASKFNTEIKSLVFPRNQYNAAYIDICDKFGINSVRINPKNWYWHNTQKNSLIQKFFRTGDAYIGINDKTYHSSQIEKISENICGQPASRLLRPNSDKKLLDSLRLRRIFQEMKFAAKKGEVYHLWWHPHNFGVQPERNLMELKDIIEYFLKLKLTYNFQSLSMEELTTK